jgi:hypothetical protein
MSGYTIGTYRSTNHYRRRKSRYQVNHSIHATTTYNLVGQVPTVLLHSPNSRVLRLRRALFCQLQYPPGMLRWGCLSLRFATLCGKAPRPLGPTNVHETSNTLTAIKMCGDTHSPSVWVCTPSLFFSFSSYALRLCYSCPVLPQPKSKGHLEGAVSEEGPWVLLAAWSLDGYATRFARAPGETKPRRPISRLGLPKTRCVYNQRC